MSLLEVGMLKPEILRIQQRQLYLQSKFIMENSLGP